MQRTWRFRRGTEEIVIVRAWDARPEDEAFVVPRFSVLDCLQQALRNRSEWSTLLSLHEELTGGTLFLVNAAQMDAIATSVSRAIESGTLVALRRPPPRFVHGILPATKGDRGAPPPSTAEELETSWVEVELLSEDNPPRPMAHARYRIELPDASVREGKLDGNGRVRLEDIPAGTCKVTFPDLAQ
ncbi:MAG TPA: hypothetical protein VEU33_11980 [Archangium sp.]|nr:hypothetical protein [Archangium sp.]